MKFEDKLVKIEDIFLDPFNPRFINQENLSQDAIFKKIFSTRDAKELLSSMSIDVKWVNKIVVIKQKDFNDKQRQINDIKAAKYLVVEGNNRLACLKSGKISNYTNETAIPILIANKEDDETTDSFASNLRVTQGIANVMVVKEWSVISKARHLYQMYYDQSNKTQSVEIKPHDIYRIISKELGIGVAEVRQSVIRYEFYKTISEISDTLPQEHWGYLEAFDRNKDLRNKFGMSQNSNMFELDSDDDGFYEEILKEIPDLIKKGANEGINTKQFRDILANVFQEIESSEDLLETIQNINDSNSNFSFKTNLNKNNNISEQEQWKENLNKAKYYIQSFPTMASWAGEFKNELESIDILIKRHIEGIK